MLGVASLAEIGFRQKMKLGRKRSDGSLAIFRNPACIKPTFQGLIVAGFRIRDGFDQFRTCGTVASGFFLELKRLKGQSSPLEESRFRITCG